MTEQAFSMVYTVSLRKARFEAKTKLDDLQNCYDALVYKKSEYSRAVNQLLDVRKAVYEIWKNAPNELEDV